MHSLFVCLYYSTSQNTYVECTVSVCSNNTKCLSCSWLQGEQLTSVEVVTLTLEGDVSSCELAIVGEEEQEDNNGHGPLCDSTGDIERKVLRKGEGEGRG